VKAEGLIGVPVLALAASLLLSGRPMFPADTPRVDEIEVLPDGPKMAQVRRYTDYGSGILPYNRWEKQTQAHRPPAARPPLKLGWSYREISFLSLPLWAYSEHGLVTYLEEPSGYKIAILMPQQVQLLEDLTGKDYSGRSFAFWKHVWGWLIVLAFAAAFFLFLREEARKREEEGIT
jgi:hypothetical protein